MKRNLLLKLIVPWMMAVLHAHGAANGEFERKAVALFATNYYFHAWNETDHAVDGEDWSLPPSAWCG
jgi:hypothetical protein